MVCAAPRVEPRVWLGDNISEAHLPTPQPGPTGALRWGGMGGPAESQRSRIFLPGVFLWEIRTVW